MHTAQSWLKNHCSRSHFCDFLLKFLLSLNLFNFRSGLIYFKSQTLTNLICLAHSETIICDSDFSIFWHMILVHFPPEEKYLGVIWIEASRLGSW